MNLTNVRKHAHNRNWPMAAVEALPVPVFKWIWQRDTGRCLQRTEEGLWAFHDGLRFVHLPRAVDALRLTHIGTRPHDRVYEKYVDNSPWDHADIQTVVDVGSFIGELHMQGSFDGIAIEADGRNYRCTVRNVPEDVQTIQAAAWYEERLLLYHEHTDGSESGVADAAHHVGKGSVPAKPVRTIIENSDEYDREDIDLVKIDAEGYEPEVLAGAVGPPVRFAVDVSEERNGERTEQLCRAVLASHGYGTSVKGDVLYAE